MSIDRGINKEDVLYTYTMEYYLAIKKNEIMPFAETWMELEILFFYFIFAFSRATPVTYGGSQARGLIGVTAASLHQSHGNAGSQAASATYTTAHGNAGSLTH